MQILLTLHGIGPSFRSWQSVTYWKQFSESNTNVQYCVNTNRPLGTIRSQNQCTPRLSHTSKECSTFLCLMRKENLLQRPNYLHHVCLLVCPSAGLHIILAKRPQESTWSSTMKNHTRDQLDTLQVWLRSDKMNSVAESFKERTDIKIFIGGEILFSRVVGQ